MFRKKTSAPSDWKKNLPTFREGVRSYVRQPTVHVLTHQLIFDYHLERVPLTVRLFQFPRCVPEAHDILLWPFV